MRVDGPCMVVRGRGRANKCLLEVLFLIGRSAGFRGHGTSAPRRYRWAVGYGSGCALTGMMRAAGVLARSRGFRGIGILSGLLEQRSWKGLACCGGFRNCLVILDVGEVGPEWAANGATQVVCRVDRLDLRPRPGADWPLSSDPMRDDEGVAVPKAPEARVTCKERNARGIYYIQGASQSHMGRYVTPDTAGEHLQDSASIPKLAAGEGQSGMEGSQTPLVIP